MRILFVLLLLVLSCGRGSSAEVPPALEQQLAERVAEVEQWAAREPAGDGRGAAVKSLPSGKPDTGDALLWSGILCSISPDKFSANCDSVEDSQGPDGRMWRHPSRVGKDVRNSFSRDMAMGLLLQVQRTGDVDMLQRWVDYVIREGQACPDAEDNRCEMTTVIWSLAKLAAPSLHLHGKKVLAPKQVLAVLYAAAVAGETGYPLHLIAQQLVLLKRAGEGNALLWQETAQALYRRDSSNALFAYLAGRPDSATLLMLEQMPRERPSGASQWSFEREGSQQSWKRSMGWEYVWLYLLMRTGA